MNIKKLDCIPNFTYSKTFNEKEYESFSKFIYAVEKLDVYLHTTIFKEGNRYYRIKWKKWSSGKVIHDKASNTITSLDKKIHFVWSVRQF